MPAAEHIDNYERRLREYTNFALRGAKKTVKAQGARPAFSESEKTAQDMMQAELRSCCDLPACEAFGKDKKASQNLIAARPPAGDTRKKLVLFAWADSPLEKPKNFRKPFALLLAACLLLLLLRAAQILFGGAFLNSIVLSFVTVGVCLLALVLVVCSLFAMRKVRKNRKPIPGAVTNLSGCFTAMALPKMLGDAGVSLRHTEITVVIAGAEEAGRRGSEAFLKAHQHEYSPENSVFAAVYSLFDENALAIWHNKADTKTTALLQKAAEIAGKPVAVKQVMFKGRFTKTGVPNATLAAVQTGKTTLKNNIYLTQDDNADALNARAIESALAVITEAAFLLDEEA